MLTEQNVKASRPDKWNLEWSTGSPIFAPLRSAASRLPPTSWPGTDVLNQLLDTRDCVISNVNEKRIRFVRQDVRPKRFEQKFEPRTYLRGEVLVRTENWHDLFNALVWMTFPFTKAAINARHYELLQGRIGGQRSAVGDALTLFDEDGIVALSSDKRVLELVRQFRWRELFWECREIVRSEMRFVVFGHAMYEKALRPFVGMTAKSILLHVPGKMLDLPGAAFNDAIDQRVAAYVRDPRNLTHGKALAPLPVLGIPGWWPQNEASNFYDDVSYFRPG